MSDAPETIWVNINDSEDGCCPVEDEHLGDGRFYDPDTATEYRRADLPPTLSAAMELPEVKAMKAALELARNRLQRLAIEFPTESEGRYEVNEWAEEATAALAAIKETKT